MENTKSVQLKFFEKIVDFNYWFSRIFRLWWVFLIIGIIAGIAGYVIAWKTPVKYKSHLTFAIDNGSKPGGSIISLASELGLGVSAGSSVFNGDNIYGILKSRRIIESVLLTTDTLAGKPVTFIEQFLINSHFFENQKHQNSHFPAGIKRDQLTRVQDSLLKKIYTHFSNDLIRVDRPDKKMSIYLLEFTSKSEEFTKKFTDELIDQANQFYTDLLTEKSKQTLETLEKQAAEMKQNLNASISGKASVQDANLNPVFSKSQVPVAQQQSNIQVYGTAYAEIFKNLEMARFQYLNARPIMQIIDNADYPMEKIRKGRLKTAAIFAFLGCLTFFLILWIRRVVFIMKHST